LKKLYKKLLVFLFLQTGLWLSANTQGIVDPEVLIGADLRKARISLSEGIRAGNDSLVIELAEVLFYSGDYEEAFKMYRRADSLRLFSSLRQRRNFSHAARLINTRSPYDRDTGFFNKDWVFDIDVETFCGNSANEDIAPFSWNDWFFIASSRGSSRRKYDFTRRPFLDIYAFWGKACQPVKLPDFLPRRINTRWHDGPIAISADTNLVIVSRNFGKPNERGVVNIFLEYFFSNNGRWSRPLAFPFASDFFSIQHPFFHDREKTLYFSSNMPGGYGGFDLYKSKWNGTGWDQPVNLGPEINSPYDEVFPSFTPSGNLVYSTNHIETSGGLDIVIYQDGIRTLFPSPINTPFDDYAIFFVDENNGFFSSNRAGKAFADNIYAFNIHVPMPVEHNYIARVVDVRTGLPVEGANIIFSSSDEKVTGMVTTNEEGNEQLFVSEIEPKAFSFEVSKPGFQTLIIGKDDPITIDSLHFIIFQMERIDKVEEPFLAQQPIDEQEVPETEPTMAQHLTSEVTTGSIVLYFENDIPARTTGANQHVAQYQVVYELYYNTRNDYYQKSASSREDLDAFFREVDDGMKNLEAFSAFIYDQLKEGRRFLVDMAAFASPIATSEYNARLSERRNASVRNYLESWQNGVLRPYIRNGSLQFGEKAFGDTQAPPNVSASRAQRDRSVYSVEASRERRVAIFWQKDEQEKPVLLSEATAYGSAYYIIAGSFRSRRGAETMVNTLKRQGAISPGILDRTPEGLFRVYYSRSQQMDLALRDLERVRRNIEPGAWIINDEGASLAFEEIRGPENYIIAGSFRNMRGAENMLNELTRKGITSAGILDRTSEGLYRVYYSRYQQPAQATRDLTNVRQSIAPDAWILSY
jgi:cell division protein FtsN